MWLLSALVALAVAAGMAAAAPVAQAQSRVNRLAVTTGGDFYMLFPQADNQYLIAGLDLTSQPQQTQFTVRVGMQWPARSGSSYPFTQASLILVSGGNQTNFGVELGYGVAHAFTSGGAQIFGIVDLVIGQQTNTRAAVGLIFPLQ